jgi:hypothetical protein
MIDETKYRLGKLKRPIENRKIQFDRLNRFVRSKNAWLISIPGNREATLECLPDSAVPAEMTKAGCTLDQLPPGERILHSAIVEKFARRADGELIPLTPGSTERVAQAVSHAGIVKSRRFSFLL